MTIKSSSKSYFRLAKILLIKLLFLVSITVYTQSQKNNIFELTKEDYSTILQDISQEIELETTDLESIAEILIRYQNQRNAVKQKTFKNPQNRQKVISNLRTSERAELKEVLGKQIIPFQKKLKELKAATVKAKKLSPEDKKAMGQQIGQYYAMEVTPVVAQQRLILEEQLDDKTKKRLDYLNEQAIALQQSLVDKQKECESLNKRDKQERQKCLKSLKGIHNQMKPHRAEIADLIEEMKRDPKMAKVFEVLKEKEVIWETEINRIRAPYFGIAPEDTANFPVDANFYLKSSKPFNFVFLETDRINVSAVRNLLSDLDFFVHNKQGYLSYNVSQEGPTKIELYDVSGNKLKTVLEEHQTEGKHKLPIKLNELEEGIFIIKLQEPSNAVTKRFVFTK